MRTVLFHSYHFPPTGGSGAQRPARLVRYLPELGYRSGGVQRSCAGPGAVTTTGR